MIKDLDGVLLRNLRHWADRISPGGYWYLGRYAELWYLDLANDRSNPHGRVGFRPEELMALVRDVEMTQGLRVERDALAARVTEAEQAAQARWQAFCKAAEEAKIAIRRADATEARVAELEAAQTRVEALVVQCEAHARETTDTLNAPVYGAGAVAAMIRAAMHPTGTND